jgi:hypothetical protein
MSSNLNDICDCCGGSENQLILQLFGDKTFGITDGTSILEDFSLSDFAMPVDGHTCVGLNIESTGGTHTIFNNNLPIPLTELESGKDYARGVLLKITYPTNDLNSEEILIGDKSVELEIETFDGISTTYPLYNLFIMFTNPKSNDPAKLINKIEIINPNTDYAIRITGLVVFGTSL